MKKLVVMCIAASFIATGCDWFKRPNDNTVVTPVINDSLTNPVDTSAGKTDNTMAVKDSTKNAGKRI